MNLRSFSSLRYFGLYRIMIRANWCFGELILESSYRGFLIRFELEFNIGFLPRKFD